MYYSEGMKRHKSAKTWERTRRQNLWRHRSGIYYARLFSAGKQIWRSLKTPLFSVAEARLDAQVAEHRSRRVRNTGVRQGKLTFADAISAVDGKLKKNPELKPATRKYHTEIFATIVRNWPGITTRPLNKITSAELRERFELWKTKTSATRYNATLTAMRRIFKVGIDAGALPIDPTQGIGRSRVRQKKLELPSRGQFSAMIEHIRTAGGRFSRDAADLVCGLAFTGLRTGEAKHLLWRDLDLESNRLHIRGDAETGTKNWENRLVPLIPEAATLFLRMRSERKHEEDGEHIFMVNEAQKALNRAAARAGAKRITHHDLRHLFATTCIEAGIDIPTVSRWLGHKDGGALAMKTYGHLRDEYSAAAAKKVSFAA